MGKKSNALAKPLTKHSVYCSINLYKNVLFPRPFDQKLIGIPLTFAQKTVEST